MAFRSSATSSQANAGGPSFPVTMPAGIVVGDTLLVFLNSDGASQALTPPGAGYWTSLGSQSLSGPDGETFLIYGRIVDGTEGATQTWTILGKAITGFAAAWSGRSGALITSSNVIATANTTSNATPVSASMTGVTAAASDDVAAFIGLDVTAAGPTWTFSTISGYSNQATANSGDASISNIQTRDNVSAGATGSLATTLTRTAGTGNTGYGGFVVNIPVAPPPPPPPSVMARRMQVFVNDELILI